MTETIQAPADVRKGRNRLAVAVVLGHGFKHVYNSAWNNILMPEVKIGMGLGGTEFGVLAGASRVSSWATTMLAGYLGDRFSHKAGLLLGISMAVLGLSYFVAGIAPNYWVLLVAMLLIGLGPALYHPPAISSLSRRFPEKRGFAVSLHGMGGSGGEVLGPLVAAGLLAVLSWQGVLRAGLLPALLVGLTIWIVMRNLAGGPEGTHSFRVYILSLVPLLKNRALQLLVAITAMRSLGQIAVTSFLPVYLREDLGYSSAVVAVYLSLAQVVGIAAQPVMGAISDRLGRKAVLMPGMAALGLIYGSLRFADPGVQLTLAILAMGAFHYSLQTILVAAAMDVAGGEVQSTVVSVIYGASFFGTMSPVFAGAIADAASVADVFLYAGGIVLLATCVVATLRLKRGSPRPVPGVG